MIEQQAQALPPVGLLPDPAQEGLGVLPGIRANWKLWLLHPRAAIYLFVAFCLLSTIVWLANTSMNLPGTWNIAFCSVALVLSLVTGVTSLAYYRSFHTRPLLFLATGFLGTGILQGIHLLQILAMEKLWTPEYLPLTVYWTVLAEAVFLGFMVMAGWRAAEGRISIASGLYSNNRIILTSAACVFIVLTLLSLLLPPVSHLSGVEIWMPAIQMFGGAGFLVALSITIWRGDWRRYHFQHWYVLFLIFAVSNQLIFVPLSVLLGQKMMVAGSLASVLAYSMAFVALLSSMSDLFRQASRRQLEDRIDKLLDGKLNVVGANGESTVLARSKTGTFELNLVEGQFFANPAAMHLYGVDKPIQDIRWFWQVVHPEDQNRLVSSFKRSRENGELFKEQYRVKSPNGYRWIECIAGIESIENKPARLLGYVEDISAEKNIEAEKESITRDLDRMIEALDQHAASASIDINGVIESANELFYEFTGLEESKLVGKKLTDILLADDNENALTLGLAQTVGGRCWVGQTSCENKQLGKRTAFSSITPHLDDNGKLDRFIYLSFDITARIEAENALQASNAAHKQSNDDLQLFAHIVSHDLQEPLRMVSSFMTLLERRYSAELNDEAREFIQYAVEGSQRMRALLDGLLDYSRVQAKDLSQESIKLVIPVQQAIDNLAVMIQETNADIQIGELPEVVGDGAQLMQLFQNLISNGIKFCKKDQPMILINARQVGEQWVVDVTDNGIGIDPSHHGRIFQIFQRLHSRSEFPGTGVGLSICYRIMQRLGGRIELDSEPGKGSTFRLYF